MLLKSFMVLAVAAVSSTASLPNKRSSGSGVVLYCYGSDANGAAVWYADGRYNLPMWLDNPLTLVDRTCVLWHTDIHLRRNRFYQHLFHC